MYPALVKFSLKHFIVFIAILNEFFLFPGICKCLCLANRATVDLGHVDFIASYLYAFQKIFLWCFRWFSGVFVVENPVDFQCGVRVCV